MVLRLGTVVTVKNTCTTPSRTLEQNKLKRMSAIATAATAVGVNIRTVRVSCGWKTNLAKSYPQEAENMMGMSILEYTFIITFVLFLKNYLI